MKTIYLIRHADAEDKGPGQKDFERNLATKGKQDAQLMGKKQKMRGLEPDLIVTSDANRAYQTAKVFAEYLGYDENRIKTDHKLYQSDSQQIMDTLFALDDDLQTVIVVGHNPEFSELVIELSDEKADVLPTCGIACFEVHANQWTDLNAQTVELVFQDFPAKGIG